MQNSIIKSYERLQRLLINEETTVTENNVNNKINIKIPLDPSEFYKDFGLLLLLKLVHQYLTLYYVRIRYLTLII